MMAQAAKGSRPSDSPIQMVPKPISSISATARRRSGSTDTPSSQARRRCVRGLRPGGLPCAFLDEGQHLAPGIVGSSLVLFEGAVEERVRCALVDHLLV